MKQLPRIRIGKKPTLIKFGEDIDFYGLFEKIEAQSENCFLFESLGEEGKFSRYSIIGFDPNHIISARNNILIYDKDTYDVENPYRALKEIMPAQTLSQNYTGGLVGYLGYDAANYFEPSLRVKTHNDFDQFIFGIYEDGLILDKLTNELFYFYYDKNRLDLLKRINNSAFKQSPLEIKFQKNTLSESDHAKIVEKVKEDIRSGKIFQCEVGFKSKYKISGDTLTIYERLRKVNPSPFMYYLKFGQKKIIGASPEILFSLRDGQMTTRPLAGTIKRGKDEKEDQQLARTLLNDPKEKAEHNMLVDLHRNDIGRVAKFGSVRLNNLMSIAKYSHVQHISSEIKGIIKNGEDMFSAVAANFPAGTLTGAPKIEAMKIIDQNEKEARGPYGGAVGHFGFNGDCTFAIALRSLFIAGEDGYTQTSGGIVYDSQPEKEYNELQNKLAAMKEVLRS